MLYIIFVSICLGISTGCLLISANNADMGAVAVNFGIMVVLGVILTVAIMANNTNA